MMIDIGKQLTTKNRENTNLLRADACEQVKGFGKLGLFYGMSSTLGGTCPEK